MENPGIGLRFKLQVIFFVILIAILGALGYFVWQYQETQKQLSELKKDPKAAAREETKKLVEKVGALVELPQGEEPTIATVTDAEKLKNQTFFAKAKNGDKVLIFTQAKRAYLYDPQANKILEIAPLNIGDQQAQVKIVLRNGTPTAGLAGKIEPEVKKALPNSEITAKENAAKSDYEKTLVVIVSPASRTQGDLLAKSLGAQVSELPQGESRPEADLVVIIGRDKQ